MKTDSTSWSQLSAEIDQYRKRARQNLQKYEKNRFHCLYKKKRQANPKTDQSFEDVPEKLGYSLNLIREKQQVQKLKSSMIVNKLNYLKVQRDRKIQSTERARTQLSRVFSIRSSTSQEKQLFKNEIKNFTQKNQESKKQINERVKSERVKIQQERLKILSQNSFRGKKTREQRTTNEETILQQRQADKAEKQKLVTKRQDEYEATIEKKHIRQQKIIEDGKINHRNHIRNQFFKYQKMKKLNQQMMNKFSIQTAKIIEETEKAQKNLATFEYFLMRTNRNSCVTEESLTKQQLKTNTPFTNHTSEEKKHPNHNSAQKNINNFFHLTN